jgi:hypothetical protein
MLIPSDIDVERLKQTTEISLNWATDFVTCTLIPLDVYIWTVVISVAIQCVVTCMYVACMLVPPHIDFVKVVVTIEMP